MPQSTPTDLRPSATSPLRYRVYSAAGNRFAVVDATRQRFETPGALARTLCGDRSRGPSFDGVLFVGPPHSGGDCSMLLHNADGSRAEACGNGLRCVAHFAQGLGRVGGVRVRVDTDRGSRVVELGSPQVDARGVRSVTARASMGRGRVIARGLELALGDTTVRATEVDVGNPHCVLEVPDLATTRVSELGPAIEFHAHFPAGTNVEFVSRTAGGLGLRVWERGVGETGACGTGACAAALALQESDDAAFELAVTSPGGTLRVERDHAGELWLTGPCEAREWVEYAERTE